MASSVSDFEKQRLANIAERDAILKQLRLESQSSGLFGKSSPKTTTSSPGDKTNSRPKKKPISKRVKTEAEPVLPLRKSSRLQGLTADSEVVKRKAEEQYQAVQAAERAKRIRKSDAFTFNDIFVSGQKLSGDSLIGVDVVTKGVANPYERTFTDEDVKKTTNKDLKALREEMRIKLTPERIYSMTFHPSEAKPLVFAGDKMGHLGILDASQQKPVSAVKHEDDDEVDDDDDPDPVMVTLKPHTRTISSMMVHPSKPTHLYTGSYDSSIRELDLEKTASVEIYAPSSMSDDEPISSIDMAPSDPHCVYWTTLDGVFGRHDFRTPTPSNGSKSQTVDQWRLSDKKIGGFSLYPSQPHYFATASLDRFMRLWDLRKLSRKDPIPVSEHESRLSVSHAAFNSAGQVATSSYDDTLKIYDFGAKGIASWKPGHTLSDDNDPAMKPDTVVRHNCQTGRWVTILRPQWQLNPQSPIQRFCIGNMNRFVDIYSGAGDQLAQLGGEGSITAVPAVAVFHRSRNWVAAGTASGKICLWM